jgi:hypothetical protein
MTAVQRSRKLTTSGSTIGELLDHPAARAILEKAMPKMLQQGDARIEKARKFTLNVSMHHAGLTEEDLEKISKQLAAISEE